ncbi:MAG: enoyl-ACP reductase [Candidatus Sumerlaeia bacterium]|nr:enoyl-ACP reductase [Candidatus Sumerlaeia bacterium]
MIDLKGKHYLVAGVANKNSIAWGVTESLLRAGATVALTYQNERLGERVLALAAEQTPPLDTHEMDATSKQQVEEVFGKLQDKWGKLDGLVHSIAYAPREDLQPGITRTPAENYLLSLHISSYTLIELTRAAMPLFEAAGGGSVITMSYNATKVFPNYNLMGIAKATLEQSMKYLAWDVGRKNVRVNAVSAGPVKTLAARGIGGFTDMFEQAAKMAPLGRNVTLEEIGNASAFLLSPLANGITGQVLFVDNGQNIIGAG